MKATVKRTASLLQDYLQGTVGTGMYAQQGGEGYHGSVVVISSEATVSWFLRAFMFSVS